MKILCCPSLTQIRFWYFMYGTNVNRLSVSTVVSQTDDPVRSWSMTGSQGDGWKKANVDLTIGRKFKVFMINYDCYFYKAKHL